MNEGSVLLASLPQADGKWKIRPVIALRKMVPYDDVLVCGVSTKLRHEVAGFDEIIAVGDSDYLSSGLAEASLIRLGYLGIVCTADIAGSLGSISPQRYRRLLTKLSEYLVK